MTILSRIETLIEYAKFGMFFCKAFNKEKTEKLCLPKSIKKISGVSFEINNSNWLNYAKTITSPYVKSFSGSEFIGSVEEIDFPNCTNIGTSRWSANNTTLRILKLSGLRNIAQSFTSGCKALEYVEFGALTNMTTQLFDGSIETMREFYIGKGTTSSLYLYKCPNLTQQSLHSCIENYADMTGTTAPLFHIGEENVAKIDDEHIAMLNRKNISYK